MCCGKTQEIVHSIGLLFEEEPLLDNCYIGIRASHFLLLCSAIDEYDHWYSLMIHFAV